MQLNRYLAQSGLCSRRGADELLLGGAVTINGTVITSPAHRVQEGDRVVFRGTTVTPPQEFSYILLNKPLGVISSCTGGEGRPTVLDCCAQVSRRVRLYPVGRLDIDSHGIVLLTNDGTLAQRLTHPRYEVSKRYFVRVDKPMSPEFLQQLRAGIHLEDGLAQVDMIRVGRNPHQCEITLHSGKNRIIRRLMAAGGYHVVDLMRVGIGPLSSRGLPSGAWRPLTSHEIERLQRLTRREPTPLHTDQCCAHDAGEEPHTPVRRVIHRANRRYGARDAGSAQRHPRHHARTTRHSPSGRRPTSRSKRR